jgi:high-affinity K+ transport system ATPase subunit B
MSSPHPRPSIPAGPPAPLEFFAAAEVSPKALAHAVCLCTLGTLAESSEESEQLFSEALKVAQKIYIPKGARFVSGGIDSKESCLRLGEWESVSNWCADRGVLLDPRVLEKVSELKFRGKRVLIVVDGTRALGWVALEAAHEIHPGLVRETPSAIAIGSAL